MRRCSFGRWRNPDEADYELEFALAFEEALHSEVAERSREILSAWVRLDNLLGVPTKLTEEGDPGVAPVGVGLSGLQRFNVDKFMWKLSVIDPHEHLLLGPRRSVAHFFLEDRWETTGGWWAWYELRGWLMARRPGYYTSCYVPEDVTHEPIRVTPRGIPQVASMLIYDLYERDIPHVFEADPFNQNDMW